MSHPASVASEYYSQAFHGPYEVFDAGDFDLQNGGKLRNLKLAYSTMGTLSPAKDNAILFPSWYSGTSKILEQAYAGSGRALDPDKYFIIFANQIGNGLSTSPSNAPAAFAGSRFPAISIADDVRAQHRLVTEHLGIRELQLVLGGSMGALQTYEWAARYPDVVKRAAPIAGTAKVTNHNAALVETFMDAIKSDSAWDGGWYKKGIDVQRGLRNHARVFAASGFTSMLFNDEGWRSIGFTSVEDFLVGFVEGHFVPQDPNNLLTLLAKWRAGDVTHGTGADLPTTLGRIKAKVFAIAIEEDTFFPILDIEREQRLILYSDLKRVSSPWGHLALFGVDPNYNRTIDGYLQELLSTPVA
ncbi:MAG: alpha/beta fold hydrolase [Hyphomicrobium sp.]|jgi:homoserine O-acetyltransferase